MFKQEIKSIFRKVWQKKKSVEEEQTIKCGDCGKSGHKTKRAKACEKFVLTSIYVGTSNKRKAISIDEETKRRKRNAKYAGTGEKRSHESEQSSKRSNRKLTKAQEIQSLIGDNKKN